MQELLDLGVDGICTNVPDVAREVLADSRASEAAQRSGAAPRSIHGGVAPGLPVVGATQDPASPTWR